MPAPDTKPRKRRALRREHYTLRRVMRRLRRLNLWFSNGLELISARGTVNVHNAEYIRMMPNRVRKDNLSHPGCNCHDRWDRKGKRKKKWREIRHYT